MNDDGGQTRNDGMDSESRYAAVLETMVDAVVTIDERGIMLSGNSAIKRTFGYETKDLIGQNVSVLMPGALGSDHDNYIQKYLDTGVASIIGIGRETVGRRADGTEFPIDLAISETRAVHRHHARHQRAQAGRGGNPVAKPGTRKSSGRADQATGIRKCLALERGIRPVSPGGNNADNDVFAACRRCFRALR